jgi:uncharacterized membrane protein
MVSLLAAVSAAVTLALTGAMAGLFFAFSTSVMPALEAISPEQAIQAMRSINRKIQNPVFFVALLGAPVAAAAMGGLLLWLDQTGAAVVAFLAAAAYVLGVFVPTSVVNVPLNEALDAGEVPTDPSAAASRWADYSGSWTRWNTLRAAFNTLSLLLVGLALFVWGRQG